MQEEDEPGVSSEVHTSNNPLNTGKVSIYRNLLNFWVNDLFFCKQAIILVVDSDIFLFLPVSISHYLYS